jgi:hypothetical protein
MSMKRIYVPTTSSDDWRKLLAEPNKQWRSGYSAKELAQCWEQAGGFPNEFQDSYKKLDNPVLHELELLLAIPEYQVRLPGGGRSSQNDLFVLARARDNQLVAIMVEGKVNEPFGMTLGKWLEGASDGKKTGLKYLCDVLGLSKEPPSHIQYQLLHRTESVIIEAKRFNSCCAMMIVHSFSSEHRWFAEYQKFLALFNVSCQANELVKLPNQQDVSVYLGWVVGKPANISPTKPLDGFECNASR